MNKLTLLTALVLTLPGVLRAQTLSFTGGVVSNLNTVTLSLKGPTNQMVQIERLNRTNQTWQSQGAVRLNSSGLAGFNSSLHAGVYGYFRAQTTNGTYRSTNAFGAVAGTIGGGQTMIGNPLGATTLSVMFPTAAGGTTVYQWAGEATGWRPTRAGGGMGRGSSYRADGRDHRRHPDQRGVATLPGKRTVHHQHDEPERGQRVLDAVFPALPVDRPEPVGGGSALDQSGGGLLALAGDLDRQSAEHVATDGDQRGGVPDLHAGNQRGVDERGQPGERALDPDRGFLAEPAKQRDLVGVIAHLVSGRCGPVVRLGIGWSAAGRPEGFSGGRPFLRVARAGQGRGQQPSWSKS